MPKPRRADIRTPLALMITRKLIEGDCPGGPKMLHETLCRVQSNVNSRRTDPDTRARDSERLQWLINLIEESGAYAPVGTRYRPLYEALYPNGDSDVDSAATEPEQP